MLTTELAYYRMSPGQWYHCHAQKCDIHVTSVLLYILKEVTVLKVRHITQHSSKQDNSYWNMTIMWLNWHNTMYRNLSLICSTSILYILRTISTDWLPPKASAIFLRWRSKKTKWRSNIPGVPLNVKCILIHQTKIFCAQTSYLLHTLYALHGTSWRNGLV